MSTSIFLILHCFRFCNPRICVYFLEIYSSTGSIKVTSQNFVICLIKQTSYNNIISQKRNLSSKVRNFGSAWWEHIRSKTGLQTLPSRVWNSFILQKIEALRHDILNSTLPPPPQNPHTQPNKKRKKWISIKLSITFLP